MPTRASAKFDEGVDFIDLRRQAAEKRDEHGGAPCQCLGNLTIVRRCRD